MDKKEIDWGIILDKISQYTTCLQSEERVKTITPYIHASLAQKNMEMIHAFKKLLQSQEGQRVRLESFEDIDSLLYSIKKHQCLNVHDLNHMRLFFEDIKALSSLYRWNDFEEIFTLKERMINTQPFLSKINQLITESGEFRSDASSLLYESFNKKKSLSLQIHKTLDKLIKDFSLEHILQDKYVTTREGRWVLPVISGKQHDFKGIIHDSSNSKQTVYMEPESVINLNNKIRELEEIIKKEIERLLKEISNFLSEKINEILKTLEAAVEIDTLSSAAKWAIDYNAQKVTLTNNKNLNLNSFFHPLLVEDGASYIKNDFKLEDKERILLLSGPNAGGKTVFLKSIGLACHMARCGLPICADQSSSVPFFKNINVIVGDHQSVEDSLSTFAAHLKSLDESLKFSGEKNLILIDEICGSTEAGEGAALARSFIEQLSLNKILGVVTSHLGPLKQGWKESSGVLNGSMNFDQRQGLPTFEFIKGIPGDSLALETARKVGVNTKIIERALFFLTPNQRKKYSGLIEIETLQNLLKQEKDTYLKKHLELEELKKEYTQMITEFKKEQDQLLEKSIKDISSNFSKNNNYLNVQNFFKNKVHLDKMKENAPKFSNTNKNNDSSSSAKSMDEFSLKFPPGTLVYVPSLKRKGVVQGQPNSKGFVPIMSDSMRILIKWSDAVSSEKIEKKHKKISSLKNLKEENIEHQTDLRGQTVEEALDLLENEIDHALQLNYMRVKVIHGHGTERVKKNVRTFLSRHPLIKSWKAEQSDGTTIAYL